MKSEKTAKELAEYLKKTHFDQLEWQEDAAGIAAFLGVELAPERAELPGWTERETSIDASTLETVRVYAGSDWLASIDGSEGSRNRELLTAFVEIHRRWLAAKRELEAWAAECCSYPAPDVSPRLRGAIKALRGED